MRKLGLSFLALALGACATTRDNLPPIQPVAQVELPRYMGDWYVIANIPPWIEQGAHNSVENYRLDEDGNIPTTFTYRKDAYDGPLKTLHSKGFVVDPDSKARWGVQFIWPIKAEYLIAWLADDYSQVIVARNARDYVWVMARTPVISDADYAALRERVQALGYDISKLNRVPQRWPDPGR